MRASVIIYLLFSFFILSGQSVIQFKDATFKQAKDIAAKEDKYIFLDAFTSWCGPCKKMAIKVFTDSAVANFYNQYFVSVQVDMEKDEGPQIARQYGIQAYPTLLYFDYKGYLVSKYTGYCDAEKFLGLGKEVLDTSNNTYNKMLKEYIGGNRSLEFIDRFVQMNKYFQLDYFHHVLNDYIGGLSKDELRRPDNMRLIIDNVCFYGGACNNNTYNTSCYNTVRENKEAFIKEFGIDRVHTELFHAVYTKAKKMLPYGEDSLQYLKILKQNSDVTIKDYVDEFNFKHDRKHIKDWADDIELSLYESKRDWASFVKTASSYAERNINVPHILNNIAWKYFLLIEDTQELYKALNWAEISIRLDSAYYNLDTYVNLLFKLGQTEKAKYFADVLLIFAKKENKPLSHETSYLLSVLNGKGRIKGDTSHIIKGNFYSSENKQDAKYGDFDIEKGLSGILSLSDEIMPEMVDSFSFYISHQKNLTIGGMHFETSSFSENIKKIFTRTCSGDLIMFDFYVEEGKKKIYIFKVS